jgi:predicted nucleic acid-binding protein
MTRLKVVADANTVIGLAKGGVFDLLAHLVTVFSVPPKVTEEVVVNGRGRPGSAELAKALGAWVVEVVPDPSLVQRFSPSLSQADREVLAVAQSGGADYILTDDRPLRREADHHKLACLRAAEVVTLLKERGLIPDVKSVLDRMIGATHGIRADVYEAALRRAGEWPTT